MADLDGVSDIPEGEGLAQEQGNVLASQILGGLQKDFGSQAKPAERGIPARRVDPPVAAKAYKIADEVGGTATAALDAPDVAQQALARKRLEDLITQRPVIGEALESNTRLRETGTDEDFDRLGEISDLFADVGSGAVGLAQQFGASAVALPEKLAGFAIAGTAGPLAQLTGSEYLAAAEEFGRERIRNADLFARYYGADLEGASQEYQAAVSGISSAADMLGIIGAIVTTRNPTLTTAAAAEGTATATAAGMAASAAAPAYEQARGEGYSALYSLGYAGVQGSIELATEKLPVSKLLEGLAKSDNFIKMMAGQQVIEGITEQVATLTGDLAEWQLLHPEGTLAEFLAERPEAAYETLIATLVGTAVQTTVAYGAASGERKERQDAQRFADFMQNVSTAAMATDLASNDPKSLQQMLDFLGARNGITSSVYLDVDTLMQLAQENNDGFKELTKRVPSLREGLTDALSGGVVEVKTSELLAGIGGTGIEQQIAQNVRQSPDAFNATEIAEEGKRALEVVNTTLRQTASNTQRSQAFAASSERLRKGFEEALAATGRLTPDQARTAALLPQAFYTVQAERMGMLPEELLARSPLSVIGQQERDRRLASRGQQPTIEQPPRRFEVTPTGERARTVYDPEAGVSLVYRVGEAGIALESVRTDPGKRGQGAASAALADLLAAADDAGLEITTEVEARGRGVDADRLAALFRRLGFENIAGAVPASPTGVPMRRLPKMPSKALVEVAPSPADAARTEAWNALPAEVQAQISEKVLSEIKQGIHEILGGPVSVSAHLGGYRDSVNSSYSLRVMAGDVIEAARLSGFVLDQEAVLAVSNEPREGLSDTPTVFVKLPWENWRDRAKIEEVYAMLRTIPFAQGEDGKMVGGFTLDEGTVSIYDFAGVGGEQLLAAVEQALEAHTDSFEIDLGVSYTRFVGESEYGYGEKSETGGRDAEKERLAGDLRSRARGLRDQLVADATALVGGDRGGRAAGGKFAPLEGAPVVEGATGPIPELVEIAEKYAADNGITFRRQSKYVEVDEERAKRIADAYAEMKHAPNDPTVKAAYADMIRQTKAQYDALVAAGFEFYFYDDTNDPYKGNPWNAMRDLRNNKRMGVYATEAGYGNDVSGFDQRQDDNPLLAVVEGIEWPYGSMEGPTKRVTANDLFRAVHDAFGHGLEGAGFRARGEENAWQAHARLFTGLAVGALTSETRGQNSWLNYGPYGEQNRTARVEDTIFADQKMGLMPDWTWMEGLDTGDGVLEQTDTLTPEFREWFGDSKAVQAVNAETGTPVVLSSEPRRVLPLTMYHTTRNSFSQFEVGRASFNTGTFGSWETTRAAIFVTPDVSATEAYGKQEGSFTEGANTIPVYVRAEKPLDLTGALLEEDEKRLESAGMSSGFIRNVLGRWEMFDGAEGKNVADIIQRAGYDSVIFNDENPDTGEAFESWAVFHPNQIKSVFNARPTEDPDILKQEASLDGAAYFDRKMLADESRQPDGSREILVYMTPAEFLSLAEEGYDTEKEKTVESVLSSGGVFNSLPYLHVDTVDGKLKVTGHEGRHRARALAARGVTSIPVVLKSRDIRWGRQTDPSYKYDYIEQWPTAIVSENGVEQAFALPREAYSFMPSQRRLFAEAPQQDPGAFYQHGNAWFYSPVIRLVENLSKLKMPKEQWVAKLRPGTPVVKGASLTRTELEWRKVIEFSEIEKKNKDGTPALDKNGNPIITLELKPGRALASAEEKYGKSFTGEQLAELLTLQDNITIRPLTKEADGEEFDEEAAQQSAYESWREWAYENWREEFKDAKQEIADKFEIKEEENDDGDIEYVIYEDGEEVDRRDSESEAERTVRLLVGEKVDEWQEENPEPDEPDWDSINDDVEEQRRAWERENNTKVKWNDEKYRAEGGDDDSYKELLLIWSDNPGRDFKYEVHYNERNFIAHARVDERTGTDGKTYLYIDELQIDWQQQGRARGFDVPGERERIIAEREAAYAALEAAKAEEQEAQDALTRKGEDLQKNDPEVVAAYAAWNEARDKEGVASRAAEDAFEKVQEARRKVSEIESRIVFLRNASGGGSTVEIEALREELVLREKARDDAGAETSRLYAEHSNASRASEAAFGFYTNLVIAKSKKEAAAFAAAKEKSILAQQAVSAAEKKNANRLVPDMPYKDSAENGLLMLKQVIRHAARSRAIDGVVLSPGYVQDERWNLAKRVSKIAIRRNASGVITLTPYGLEGERFEERRVETDEGRTLEDYVGKKLAARFEEDSKGGEHFGEYDAEAIRTSQEKQLTPFYDTVLSREMKKLVKTFGAETKPVSFQSEDGMPSDFNPNDDKYEARVLAKFADGRVVPLAYTAGSFLPSDLPDTDAENLLHIGARLSAKRAERERGIISRYVELRGLSEEEQRKYERETPVALVAEYYEKQSPEDFAFGQEPKTRRFEVYVDPVVVVNQYGRDDLKDYMTLAQYRRRLENSGTGGSLENVGDFQESVAEALKRLSSKIDIESSKKITGLGFEFTPELREFATQSMPLFQKPGSQPPLGEFNPYERTIALLNTSNLSTFLHEAGHAFLELQMEFAGMPEATDEMRADSQALLDWLGFKGTPAEWKATPVDDRRRMHEKFANSFEHYLFTGNAPSLKLRKAFETFAQWLKQVYRSLQSFLRQYPEAGQLNESARMVLDRMLASEQEIAEAKRARGMAALMASAKPEGMSQEDFAAFLTDEGDATREAENDLNARKMRDMAYLRNAHGREVSRLKRRAATLRRAMIEQVLADFEQQPAYAALAFLRKGKMPAFMLGNEATPVKLNAAEVDALFPPGENPSVDALRRGGRYSITSPEGVSPHDIASLFGFESAEAMLLGMANARPLREAVADEVDARMLEQHGELASDAAIAKAADRAVHNAAFARVLATQQAALDKLTNAGSGGARDIARATKEFAERSLARMKVRDIKPLRFISAETRLAKEVDTATAKNDMKTAAARNRQRLIQHNLASEAYKAEEEIEQIVQYLKRFGKKSVREKMGGPDLQQLDALLERFDLRVGRTLKSIDSEKQALKEFVAQRAEELGVMEPDIEAWLENEGYRKSYKELTLGELRGLRDAARQLEMLARREREMYKAIKGQTLQEETEALLARMREAHPDAFDAEGNPKAVDVRNKSKIAVAKSTVIGDLVGLEAFSTMLGGGAITESLFRRLSDASNYKAKRLGEIAGLLTPLFKAYSYPERVAFSRVDIGTKSIGFRMTREEAVVAALLYGSDTGRQRLQNYGWGDSEVQRILSLLDERDLALVNGIWSMFDDNVWPELKELNERTRGVAPEKTPPAPYTVKGVTMRGGYFPLKYHAESMQKQDMFRAEESLSNIRNGLGASAKTRDSASKKRNESVVGQPILSLSVMSQVLNETVHDVAFREAVVDTHRLLRQPAVRAAVIAAYGYPAYDAMLRNVGDVAASPVEKLQGWERIWNLARRNTAVTLLSGFKTAVINLTGIFPAMHRVNPFRLVKNFTKFNSTGGAFAFIDAKKYYEQIVSRSDYMRGRFTAYDRDLQEAAKQFTVNGKILPETGVSLFLMGWTDRMVACSVWMTAYEEKVNEAIKAGGTQESADRDATQHADEMVRQTQGSGREVDLAQVMRGSQTRKLFTMFYSYFNQQLQQLITAGAISAQKARENRALAVANFTGAFIAVHVLPVVAGLLLGDVVDGDDEWPSEEDYLRGIALYGFAYFPFGRIAGPYLVNAASPGDDSWKYSSVKMSPATSAIEGIGKAGVSLVDILNEEGDVQDIRKVIFGVGFATGIPGKLIADATTGGWAFINGDAGPLAVLTGPPK